jgi:hypothetical protein
MKMLLKSGKFSGREKFCAEIFPMAKHWLLLRLHHGNPQDPIVA